MDLIPLFRVFMSNESKARVGRVLDSGYIGQGPISQGFEQALANLEGAKNVLATSSCTHALDLAYHLCGIGPGSTVISTPMTCTATNTQLLVRGARIMWADVSPLTGLIDPDSVARCLMSGTKAIVAVDWAGRLANYRALKKLGVPVIQDSAHSLLAEGESGTYRCWSFQAIKHVTCGDGGALSVPDEDKLKRAKLLRWYGLDRESSADFRCKQDIVEAGYKYGMNDIAAAIGMGNLNQARWIVSRHRENASQLHRDIDGNPHVQLPPYDPTCSYWVFPILAKDSHARDLLSVHLANCGFASSQVHSRNDTKTCFRDALHPNLPGVDEFSRRQLNIPCGWWLEDVEVNRLKDAIWSFEP